MRNSWAINRPFGQPLANVTDKQSYDFLTSSLTSHSQQATQMDTLSMNNQRQSLNGYSRQAADRRNKYNTLTPAEAKKLKGFLNSSRQPIRTASVLHKPRAPPIIVSSEFAPPQPPRINVPPTPVRNDTDAYESRRTNLRSASSCSNRVYRDNRHSINYGQLYASNRLTAPHNLANDNKCSLRVSPSDSETNLSFRGSFDVIDSAYGSDRLQTISADLVDPLQQLNNDSIKRMNNHQNSAHYSDYSQEQNKLSDDSYTSAKSHHSESIKCQKSISRTSLSSSTSKVFQNQLGNIKKFFRYMPLRRSFLGIDQKLRNEVDCDKQDLSESISRICLNRSQSPPICPPPPKELKSLSYMESASVNYSNYDEFTRARNQQTSTLRNNYYRNDTVTSASPAPTVNTSNQPINDDSEYSDAWQLQSLPVSYERNLTTVFEERQNLADIYVQNRQSAYSCLPSSNYNNGKHLIEPPSNFDDKNAGDCVLENVNNLNLTNFTKDQSISSSSLATTTDSVLDYQRQNATSFRFSYAQPNAFIQGNNQKINGLPPRTPILDSNKQGCISSSNTSLTLDGSNNNNNCDQKTFDSRKSLCSNSSEYGITNGFDNDGDVTILSDTSTLHGDSNNMLHVNKCVELERNVDSLKNKLMAKEKELVELQLKQLSSHHLIDQLKSTIVRLEKENAQLKNVVKQNKV